MCVFHNGDLAEVSWEQREMEGEPLFPDSQDLPAFPYAGYAELLGLRGIRVDDPDRLGSAWEAALTADRPTVLEVLTDRAVPLLAPFPAGAEKLESMRKGLAAEGESGRHARELLDVYAAKRAVPPASRTDARFLLEMHAAAGGCFVWHASGYGDGTARGPGESDGVVPWRCRSRTTRCWVTRRPRRWWAATARSTGCAFPRFDSGAVFAALLGTEEHGRWLLAPAGEVTATSRRYRDNTLILETEMRHRATARSG